MRTVELGGLIIGGGRPKVFAPIVGRTRQEILCMGADLSKAPVDAVEWRADFCEDVTNYERLVSLLRGLKEVLGEKPLLFTLRTKSEGGELTLSSPAYEELLRVVLESRLADAVDVEMFGNGEAAGRLIALAGGKGVPVIGSSHDFSGTPPKEEILSRLLRMQEMGADILKIAVMPRSMADVLTLLSALEEMNRCYADRPVAAMSMSELGVISRVAGEAFGSCLTFGAAGRTSAPGQIPVEELNAVLEILHRRCPR